MARDNRIAMSFVFGLVGGVLIIVTIFLLLPLFTYPYYYTGLLFGAFGLTTGIVSGAFVIIAAAMSFRRPEHALPWGIVEVVFGALSIFALGGLIIGMAFRSRAERSRFVAGSTADPSGAGSRACTNCGMLIPMEFAHCPHCAHAVAPLPR